MAKAELFRATPLIEEHRSVYNQSVKKRDLEKRLRDLGWRLLRHGARHDAWTNADGTRTEFVPRHNEVNENLAKAILKNAES